MANKWKTAFVVIGIICLILGAILVYQSKNKTYDFAEGFEIKASDFNEIADNFEYGEVITLCREFEEGRKCIKVGRLSK